GVSPGRADGPVAQLAGATPPPDAGQRLTADADVEAAAQEITAHAAKVADGLNAAAESAEGEAAEILATTAQMAADPTLVTAAQAKVRDERKPPALAVWEAADDVAEQLSALGGYMAERARDVRDVRDRIAASLQALPMPGIPQPHEPFVLRALDSPPA